MMDIRPPGVAVPKAGVAGAGPGVPAEEVPPGEAAKDALADADGEPAGQLVVDGPGVSAVAARTAPWIAPFREAGMLRLSTPPRSCTSERLRMQQGSPYTKREPRDTAHGTVDTIVPNAAC